jgi:hypothetical protein
MPASLLSTDSVFRDEWKSLSRDSRLGGDPLGADCRQRLAQVGTRPFLFLKLTFQQSITRRTAPPAASCISALLHSDVACLIRPNRTKRRLPNQSVRVDKQQATHGVDLQRYNVPLSRGVFQSLRPPLRSLGPARARICRLETVWFLNHDQNIGPFSWGMTKAPSGTTEKRTARTELAPPSRDSRGRWAGCKWKADNAWFGNRHGSPCRRECRMKDTLRQVRTFAELRQEPFRAFLGKPHHCLTDQRIFDA